MGGTCWRTGDFVNFTSRSENLFSWRPTLPLPRWMDCRPCGERCDPSFWPRAGNTKPRNCCVTIPCIAQAIGQAAIQHGYRVLYREAQKLLEELADATIDGTRKEYMESLVSVPLLIIDDFGMRKLPLTAAEDLLEIIMRRYERASTLLTSNCPVEDCRGNC